MIVMYLLLGRNVMISCILSTGFLFVIIRGLMHGEKLLMMKKPCLALQLKIILVKYPGYVLKFFFYL